ncbi:MAG TPA: Flp family type IVb pilin [Thermoguttaceae bacterium]
MKSFIRKIAKFLKTECGPTAVEYAVIIALVILVCFTSIIVLGRQANTSLEHSNNEIRSNIGR